MELRRAAVWR
uniref:Uncharacterized protein n=1 Tax=Rhizophora mucronata TaxID=61149 RepID=A0A2P2IQ70_RHIMU